MRLILFLALVFTAMIGLLTVRDIEVHGLTVPGVFGAGVVILLGVGLLGALLHRPRP